MLRSLNSKPGRASRHFVVESVRIVINQIKVSHTSLAVDIRAELRGKPRDRGRVAFERVRPVGQAQHADVAIMRVAVFLISLGAFVISLRTWQSQTEREDRESDAADGS